MQKTELKFNSQICTTKIQSQRLLDLGLKPETADMKHLFDNRNDYSFFHHWECFPYEWDKESLVNSENIPAWSLHRLLLLCDVTAMFTRDILETAYDDQINAIENLIKNGYFNKEYLKP
jgi:hypothetical protein